jgi:biotin carboxylase
VMTLALLLLDTTGPDALALARAANEAGYRLFAADGPYTNDNQLTPQIRRLLAGSISVDFTQPQQVDTLTEYIAQIGISGVLTTNEYLTPTVAQLCARAGLPGNDVSLAHTTRNKTLMNTALRRHGLHLPRTATIKTATDLAKLLRSDDIQIPCIVKPIEAAGSIGVTVIDSPVDIDADIGAAVAAARTADTRFSRINSQILVQELITGTEFSVESITTHGVTTLMAITEKVVTPGRHRTELGHFLPAVIDQETRRSIEQQALGAIASTGIRNGAAHTELIVDPSRGPVIIEVAARIAAGHIGRLIQEALGIDVWTALLDTALGHQPSLTPTLNRHAAVRFLTSPHTGCLIALHGLPDIDGSVVDVQIRSRIGDHVHFPHANNGRLGHFIVVGDDPSEIHQIIQTIESEIQIEVNGLPHHSSAAQPTQPNSATIAATAAYVSSTPTLLPNRKRSSRIAPR